MYLRLLPEVPQVNVNPQMAGKLDKGQSGIKIQGENLTGWVQAQYQELEVQIEKTKSRGEISTFFQNLVKSLKLRSSTVDRKPVE